MVEKTRFLTEQPNPNEDSELEINGKKVSEMSDEELARMRVSIEQDLKKAEHNINVHEGQRDLILAARAAVIHERQTRAKRKPIVMQ